LFLTAVSKVKLLATIPFRIIILCLLLTACSDVRDEVPDAEKEILAYFRANDTTSIPFSNLAKHPVTRVYVINNSIGNSSRRPLEVNEFAGAFGFDIPGTIDEGKVGFLMMNEKQATVRQVSARVFDPGVPYAQGNNIKLKFEPLDPIFKWQNHTNMERAIRLHMRPRLVTD
jgi:hypothetical protein